MCSWSRMATTCTALYWTQSSGANKSWCLSVLRFSFVIMKCTYVCAFVKCLAIDENVCALKSRQVFPVHVCVCLNWLVCVRAHIWVCVSDFLLACVTSCISLLANAARPHAHQTRSILGRANPIVATGLFTLQAGSNAWWTSNKMGPGSIFSSLRRASRPVCMGPKTFSGSVRKEAKPSWD